MAVTAAPTRRTVKNGEYKASHGKAPRGYGYWGFINEATGDVVWITGTVTDCVKQLPKGTWQVAP